MTARKVGTRVRLWCTGLAVLAPLISTCGDGESLQPIGSGPPNPRIIWRIDGHSSAGRPAFDGTAAYFLGGQHQVTAVEKQTGRLRWAITLPVERGGTLGYGFAVGADRLIVGDVDLFALDVNDGKILWRYTPSQGRYPGFAVPALSGGVVYAGSSSGHVYAVDAATGAEQWATHVATTTNVNVYDPRVVDGVAYVGFTDFDVAPNEEPQGGVAALDASTGAVRWQRWLPHNVDSLSPTATLSVVVAGPVVVASARDGPVYGLDLATGAVRWEAAALKTAGAMTEALIRDIRPLSTDGRYVFVGSTLATVLALDPATGKQIWSTEMTYAGASLFTTTDATMTYIVHAGGQLEALDNTTGRVRWVVSHDPLTLMAVAADPDRIYAGSVDAVYALKKD